MAAQQQKRAAERGPIALVTGGSGFIGSHLVRELVSRGFDVRVLVRPTSDLSRLSGAQATLVEGDVLDRGSLATAVAGVDYVFHLAALTMATSREAFESTNAGGTRNILDAVASTAPDLKRFILVSSQAAAGPNPDAKPMTEASPVHPISWYGQSKADAELLCQSSGVPFSIVRPVSVYGPGERDLSRTWDMVAGGIRPHVGFRAGQISLVQVKDLVDGICAAALNDAADGQVFFLGHPTPETSWSLVDAVAEVLDVPFTIPLPVPLVLLRLAAPFAEWTNALTGARPALTRDKALEISQPRWVASPAKAMTLLSWSPQFDLLSGLRQTIPSWRQQRRRAQVLEGDTLPGGLFRSILFTLLIGCVIETTCRAGQFYVIDPWWGAFVLIVFAFGVGLGAIAWFARGLTAPIRYLLGAVAATTLELLNAANLLPLIHWTFAPGWPFGIQNNLLRSLVLGQAGGVVVLLGGAIAKAFWNMRHGPGAQVWPPILPPEPPALTSQSVPNDPPGGPKLDLPRVDRANLKPEERGQPTFLFLIKYIWRSLLASLRTPIGKITFSAFLLIMVWGQHGRLELLGFVLRGWLGPGEAPYCGPQVPPTPSCIRPTFIPGFPFGWDAELISFAIGFLLLVIIPCVVIRLWLKEPLRAFGLGAPPPDRRKLAIVGFLLLTVVSLPAFLLGSRDPSMMAVYPFYRHFGGWLDFGAYEIMTLLFYVTIEFIFRGYLLFAGSRYEEDYRQRVGNVSFAPFYDLPKYTLLVQMLSYTAWHLGKPLPELWGTLPWGIAAGAIAYASRSVWPVVASHWLLNVGMDAMILRAEHLNPFS